MKLLSLTIWFDLPNALDQDKLKSGRIGEANGTNQWRNLKFQFWPQWTIRIYGEQYKGFSKGILRNEDDDEGTYVAEDDYSQGPPSKF